MYRIGDFSKITKLTVKALRYYDKEGILVPSHRDEESSYRYYDEINYEKALQIKLLRDLEFTISEIKEVIDLCEDSIDLSCILEEKKEQIKKKIYDQKAQLKKIDDYIKPKLKEENKMEYKIEIKEMPSITVASIRYNGKYSDCGKYIGKLYKAVKGKAIGEPINCYYDGEYKEIADIETCLPIKEKIDNQDISCKELPGIKAITTIHKGSYDGLNKAYKALLNYANENNFECLLPSREVYKKGPGMIFAGNPDKYITEIMIPIV